MKPKAKKKGQEQEFELKSVKEHFICRNECAKDIWIEKLAVASNCELKTINEEQ